MTFNESNTVEAFIRDYLSSIGWEFIAHGTLPHQPQDVLVEEYLCDEALVRLNPATVKRANETPCETKSTNKSCHDRVPEVFQAHLETLVLR